MCMAYLQFERERKLWKRQHELADVIAVKPVYVVIQGKHWLMSFCLILSLCAMNPVPFDRVNTCN